MALFCVLDPLSADDTNSTRVILCHGENAAPQDHRTTGAATPDSSHQGFPKQKVRCGWMRGESEGKRKKQVGRHKRDMSGLTHEDKKRSSRRL